MSSTMKALLRNTEIDYKSTEDACKTDLFQCVTSDSLRSCEAWWGCQYSAGWQWRSTAHFEEHRWLAGQRKPSCEAKLSTSVQNIWKFVCKYLFCFAGVGGGEQHGGGGQTAAAAVPGTVAATEHRKQWCIDSFPVSVSAQLTFSFKISSFCCSEKAEIFLEIFGNSEIRAQTEETLKCVASNLSQSVTETLETPTHSCLNTTSLKVPAGVKYANLWPHGKFELNLFPAPLCVCAVQGAGWAGQDIQDVDAASVLLDPHIQSLGLSGQAALRNTLRLEEWQFRLGPQHETARERGI